MDSRKLITSAEGKEIVINGWKSTPIYDALKREGKKLPNMDPFPNIDPLMGDNPTTVETNLDTVCQLDQKQLDSFRSQRDNVTKIRRKNGNLKTIIQMHSTYLITLMTNHLCKTLSIFWTRYVMIEKIMFIT